MRLGRDGSSSGSRSAGESARRRWAAEAAAAFGGVGGGRLRLPWVDAGWSKLSAVENQESGAVTMFLMVESIEAARVGGGRRW